MRSACSTYPVIFIPAPQKGVACKEGRSPSFFFFPLPLPGEGGLRGMGSNQLVIVGLDPAIQPPLPPSGFPLSRE